MTPVIGVGRPSRPDLERLLAAQADEPFAYAPVGMVRDGGSAPGWHHHLDRRRIGTGADDYENAVAQLRGWQAQRGAGLTVVPTGEVAEGVDVVIVLPLPVLAVTIACRVAYVIDEPDRWGFGYGTLEHHAEQGEETFVVERDGDDAVWFTVESLSRWRHPLARLGAPVSLLLQRTITRRYLAALDQRRSAPLPAVHQQEEQHHG